MNEPGDGFWWTKEFPRLPGDRPLLDAYTISVVGKSIDVDGREKFLLRFDPGGHAGVCWFVPKEDWPNTWT